MTEISRGNADPGELLREIAAHKRRVEMLEQKLCTHPRSGLPNHHTMSERIDLLCSNDKLDDKPKASSAFGAYFLGVILIRLQRRYEMLARSMRPWIVDWLLFQVGERLQETLDSDEELFHTRDDEFSLIVRLPLQLDKLRTRLSAFHDAVTEPHIYSGHHVNLEASMGIALFGKHGNSQDRLLHCAEIALSNSQKQRRKWMIFEDSMESWSTERRELEDGLLRALELPVIEESPSQFFLVYQPQVHLRSRGDGSWSIEDINAEVLLRWQHPDRGSVSPETFIPIAEESGLIMPVGNLVLFRAIEQLALWKDQGFDKIKIAINMSPRQFGDPVILQNLVQLMKQDPQLHSRLKIEITESSVLEDPEGSIAHMRNLIELGVHFALDDFGKGYSSLNYLTSLPLDTIKLDRAFIMDIETNPTNQAIVQAVVFLAEKLNLNLICEGVETKEQLVVLLHLGCRVFQGFYFSRPLECGKFIEFLSRKNEIIEI